VLDAAAWTAIVFLMLGLLLLLIEVLNPGFFIAVPGGTLAIMGSIGLVAPGLMFGSAAWFLWPLAAVAATSANLWVYKRWAPPGRAPVTSSVDSMPGKLGRVETEVVPGHFSGKVLIEGATWSARVEDGESPIPAGSKVRVARVEGVHVVVESA
jgi:membrane protein implicated in regulation of membrane protease activity